MSVADHRSSALISSILDTMSSSSLPYSLGSGVRWRGNGKKGSLKLSTMQEKWTAAGNVVKSPLQWKRAVCMTKDTWCRLHDERCLMKVVVQCSTTRIASQGLGGTGCTIKGYIIWWKMHAEGGIAKAERWRLHYEGLREDGSMAKAAWLKIVWLKLARNILTRII